MIVFHQQIHGRALTMIQQENEIVLNQRGESTMFNLNNQAERLVELHN